MRLVPQRPPSAPGDVVARAGLPRGEKVLAFLQAGDSWLLGTRAAFVVVGTESVRRILWEQVEKAGWDRDESVLLVSEVGEWGRPRPEHRFTISEPGRLLELMRERVTASVVLQRRAVVSGRRGLNVIARRAPAGGPLEWFVEYDAGVDPEDPVVRELAGKALDEARAELGAELI
jgi:hypothetical protein